MFWSLVRPDRILPPITRSAAVMTSLEAGELTVGMITRGGRTHDHRRSKQRKVSSPSTPPCRCALCCFKSRAGRCVPPPAPLEPDNGKKLPHSPCGLRKRERLELQTRYRW